jgi:hypothetical protein
MSTHLHPVSVKAKTGPAEAAADLVKVLGIPLLLLDCAIAVGHAG